MPLTEVIPCPNNILGDGVTAVEIITRSSTQVPVRVKEPPRVHTGLELNKNACH